MEGEGITALSRTRPNKLENYASDLGKSRFQAATEALGVRRSAGRALSAGFQRPLSAMQRSLAPSCSPEDFLRREDW
jgi:hypothetical protein